MAVEINRNSEERNDKVKLLSSDGDTFEVRKAVALQSVIITKLMEDLGTEETIPTFDVSSNVLELLIKYCEYHVDHPPSRMETINDIDPWDVSFLDIDYGLLSLISMAAHYLDIESLTRLVCRKLGEIIQSLETPEMVRRVLHIENDLSPEMEAEIKRANQWAFAE